MINKSIAIKLNKETTKHTIFQLLWHYSKHSNLFLNSHSPVRIVRLVRLYSKPITLPTKYLQVTTANKPICWFVVQKKSPKGIYSIMPDPSTSNFFCTKESFCWCSNLISTQKKKIVFRFRKEKRSLVDFSADFWSWQSADGWAFRGANLDRNSDKFCYFWF